MKKGEVFFAVPNANRWGSLQLSEESDHGAKVSSVKINRGSRVPKQVEANQLNLNDIELNDSKISRHVRQARDEFDRLFDDFSATMESQYDVDYKSPMAQVYDQRASAKKPTEKLFWWNGGNRGVNKEECEAGCYANSFFQDKRWSQKLHSKSHPMGEESGRFNWKLSDKENEEKISGNDTMKSTTRESYGPPKVDYVSLLQRRRPVDSLRLDNLNQPQQVSDEEKLKELRFAFEEEISHLHNTDFPITFETETSSNLRDPKLVQAELLKSAQELPKTRDETAYSQAFKSLSVEDLLKAQRQRPAGISKWKIEQGASRDNVGNPTVFEPPVSEYKAAFLTRDLLEKEGRDREEAKLRKMEEKSRNQAALSAERQQQELERMRWDLRERRKNFEFGSLTTEHHDRYDPSQSVENIDPGFVSSPKKKPLHPKAPIVTEYNVEYGDAQPPFELRKKVKPLQAITDDDMKPGLVTEYEGRYCGYDEAQIEKRLAMAKEEREKKNALKPAYSMKPDAAGHKHHLFSAEINPGYVSRTEHMSAYGQNNSVKPEDKYMETMKLKNAMRGAEDDKVEDSAKDSNIGARKPMLTHEEMLARESNRNLNWWRNSGYRLWTTLNPLTQNLRYAPFTSHFKTPKTEYQSSFVR